MAVQDIASLYKHPESVNIIRLKNGSVVRRTTNTDGTSKDVNLFAADYPDAEFETAAVKAPAKKGK